MVNQAHEEMQETQAPVVKPDNQDHLVLTVSQGRAVSLVNQDP